MSKTGAFFDVDGTLYRDSLMIEHFKKLLKYEVLDEALWHTNVKHTYENWKKRRGNFDDYLLELSEIYVDSLKGMEKSKLDFISSQVVDLKGDKVYMYTRDRIKWHQRQGHPVFFISGSPDYLVKKMARRYAATDCVGTRYLLDEEERFTGEVIRMWDNESKQKAMHALAETHDVDLSASWAYGDTNGDLSMFRLTGHAVAINPSRELLNSLRKDPELGGRVQVVVERKDVIYLLDPAVEICCAELGENGD